MHDFALISTVVCNQHISILQILDLKTHDMIVCSVFQLVRPIATQTIMAKEVQTVAKLLQVHSGDNDALMVSLLPLFPTESKKMTVKQQ